MNKDIRVLKIKQIRFINKWVQFWFSDDPGPPHESCKRYMLDDINYVGSSYIANHGYRNLYLVWKVGADRPIAMFKSENS